MKNVRMLAFGEYKIIALLTKGGIEFFTFNNQEELRDAVRLWATIPDEEKPPH